MDRRYQYVREAADLVKDLNPSWQKNRLQMDLVQIKVLLLKTVGRSKNYPSICSEEAFRELLVQMKRLDMEGFDDNSYAYLSKMMEPIISTLSEAGMASDSAAILNVT